MHVQFARLNLDERRAKCHILRCAAGILERSLFLLYIAGIGCIFCLC